jgi:LysM domain
MRIRAATLLLSLCTVVAVAPRAAGDEPQAGPGASCIDAVLAKVQCANPDEVCRILAPGRDPRSGSNVDAIFDFRTQDLGDGTQAYVFSHKPGKDAYVYLPNFHFLRNGDRLALFLDGKGVPVTYLVDRPKLNGRYQLERVSRADTGLYRKREEERWFWNGSEYAVAFTRLTMEKAKDPKLNGVTTTWNGDAQEAYRKASKSWTHTVVAGDTLGAIAKKYGVSIDEIMRQNDIRNAAGLRLGQQIRYEGWKVTAR